MTNRFGFFASIAAFAAAVGYGIPQLLQVAGVLADPWDRILIFAPSLLLAPAFVLTMAALHAAAALPHRAFTLGAFGLAVMYGTLVSIVYVIQLGAVIPRDLRGEGGPVAAFACCGYGQPLTMIDLLGYTLMSFSTLCAAPAFTGPGLARKTRLWFIANGLLAPFLLLQVYWPGLIYVGALWLVTFPAAMLCLALLFRRPGTGS